MGTEKFCLRWNDFESNISSAFREIKDDKDFFDVTIACDDDQIQAHKVIISACSPFFRTVLKRNPHQHPLLYLKGVKYTDLQSVLDFMYHGEVNVAQEELNSFLAVAEDLMVKGLTQNTSGNKVSRRESHHTYKSPTLERNSMEDIKSSNQASQKKSIHNIPISQHRSATPSPQTRPDDNIQEVVSVKTEPREPATRSCSQIQPVALTSVEEDRNTEYHEEQQAYEDYGHYEEQQYDEQPTDLTIQGDEEGKDLEVKTPEDLLKFVILVNTGFLCSICGKHFRTKREARCHVESIHFPQSFTYSCDYCGKEFNTLNIRNIHITRHHKKQQKTWSC